MDLYNEIQQILVKKCAIEESLITQDTKLVEILDSVDRMYLILDIKKKYHIDFSASDIAKITTIQSLVNLISAVIHA